MQRIFNIIFWLGKWQLMNMILSTYILGALGTSVDEVDVIIEVVASPGLVVILDYGFLKIFIIFALIAYYEFENNMTIK
eukprot:UN00030